MITFTKDLNNSDGGLIIVWDSTFAVGSSIEDLEVRGIIPVWSDRIKEGSCEPRRVESICFYLACYFHLVL